MFNIYVIMLHIVSCSVKESLCYIDEIYVYNGGSAFDNALILVTWLLLRLVDN